MWSNIVLLAGYIFYDNSQWNVEKKGTLFFQLYTSSLCVSILETIPDDDLKSNSEHIHEDTSGEVNLCDTFFYTLFAYKMLILA